MNPAKRGHGSAVPDYNLYQAKQRMLSAFEPLNSTVDVERLLDRAFQIAEVFR